VRSNDDLRLPTKGKAPSPPIDLQVSFDATPYRKNSQRPWCGAVMNAPLESLLEAPSPAVLITYRKNGEASASPVWFRFHDGHFEVVIAENDVKLRHLASRPQCELVVFEAVPPFRGIRVRSGEPKLVRAGAQHARAAIAMRYLGEQLGQRFAADRCSPAVLLRLPSDGAKTWDLSAILPDVL
jgi:hypothetical protein